MPAMTTQPTQLEVDIANALGVDLATTVRGSLVIDFDSTAGMRARWDGAMVLTEEQAAAVRRIVEEDDARRRAANGTDRARRAMAALTPEQRLQVLADLEVSE